MPEFRRKDADHACRWRGRAGSEDELIAKVADHVRSKHAVHTPTETIVSFVRSNVRP